MTEVGSIQSQTLSAMRITGGPQDPQRHNLRTPSSIFRILFSEKWAFSVDNDWQLVCAKESDQTRTLSVRAMLGFIVLQLGSY